MANEIHNPTKYLAMYDEGTWATMPNSPTYIHVPVFDYSVRMRPENRTANPYLGIFQRKHSRNFRGLPAGQMNAALYGWRPSGLSTSLAEYLLKWAFNEHETRELPSKAAEWAEGPNVANKRATGLRVDTAILRGSEASGIVDLSLDLLGKDEAGFSTAQTLPDDREKAVEFEFPDCTFSLNGSAIQLEAFALQNRHNLRPHFLNDDRPSLLVKRTRLLQLIMVPPKNADTYDAYRRLSSSTEITGEIVLKGLHNGTGSTGNYAKVTIEFPRLSFVDAEEQGEKDELAFQPLIFNVLKPDTSALDMTMTFSESDT